jgi:hypothetical protein
MDFGKKMVMEVGLMMAGSCTTVGMEGQTGEKVLRESFRSG